MSNENNDQNIKQRVFSFIELYMYHRIIEKKYSTDRKKGKMNEIIFSR